MTVIPTRRKTILDTALQSFKVESLNKKGRPVSFRPSAEVAKWLEVAQNAEFDISQLINMCLETRADSVEEVSQIGAMVKYNIERKREFLNTLVKEDFQTAK